LEDGHKEENTVGIENSDNIGKAVPGLYHHAMNMYAGVEV
jgi:hypothetical protein